MQSSKIKIAIVLLIIGITFIGVKYCRENVVILQALEAAEQAGLWAPVVYILVYILISGVLIPSIVIKIFAGTLFGVAWGIVLVCVASTISSSVKFLLARYLFRDKLVEKIERSEKLKTIDRAIERDGWKVLIFLRNIPIVNSMLLNYICGVTKMGFKDFAVASFIGRLPTTIMYVYLGYIVRYTYTAELAAGGGRYLTLERSILFIGLAATVGLSLYLIHLSRRILIKKAPSIPV